MVGAITTIVGCGVGDRGSQGRAQVVICFYAPPTDPNRPFDVSHCNQTV